MGLADPAVPRGAAGRVRRRAGAARQRSAQAGGPGATPRPRWRRRARRHGRRRSATRIGCATPSRNWPTLRARGGRGGTAGRRAAGVCSRARSGAEAIAAALAELAPRDRRSAGPAAALRAAGRALQRLMPGGAGPGRPGRRGAGGAGTRGGGAGRGRDAARPAWREAAEADPRRLEQAEERLFALRAAARKHQVRGGRAAGACWTRWRRGWRRWRPARREVEALAAAAAAARAAYVAACAALSAARRAAAAQAATGRWRRELPPLRLDKARFVTDVARAGRGRAGGRPGRMRCAS